MRSCRSTRSSPRVVSGEFDAGLIIHEGQLTYGDNGLHKILDMAQWWRDETGGLPLPLGANAIKRSLGSGEHAHRHAGIA